MFKIFIISFREKKAQSQAGYNYPSPFNPLAPGAAGDLGGLPGSNAQPPTSYPGSQPAYNPQFTPSGNFSCLMKIDLKFESLPKKNQIRIIFFEKDSL